MHLVREMNCSEEEIEHIRRGALIHDIGKMAIPDNILSKPGPLDNEEKKIMEKHTVYAKEMLEPISFLSPAAIISYCHHERWDGCGYPQGLKGDEIPSQRGSSRSSTKGRTEFGTSLPEGMAQGMVISYLRDNSGKCFDPCVVEVFLRIVGER